MQHEKIFDSFLYLHNQVRVDIRVVAATNRRLEEAVAAGNFREDLYFRLNVFPIELPPLRERLGDLGALVEHLAARLRPRRPPRFSPGVITALEAHAWPGNIRELANIVERLSIIGGDEVTAEMVPRALRVTVPAASLAPGEPPMRLVDDGRGLTDRLDDFERDLINAALTSGTGNIAEAARLLKTDRGNLYRRMRRLGIRGGNDG